MRVIDPDKSLTDVIVFYLAANVQLDGELLKIYSPKLTAMRGVESAASLFINYVSKISIVYQIILGHKAIYNPFGSGFYHKLIPYLNQNHMNFTTGILACLMGMIPEWHDISLG